MAKTYNTIPSVATGDLLTATAWNNQVTNVNNYRVVAACRARNTTNQSIPNNSTTVVSFPSEDYDTDDMHSTSVNTSRLTITTPGVYAVSAGVVWDINGTGLRVCTLRINGTTNIADISQTNVGAANFTSQTLTTHYSFVLNDYVELTVYQNSGGALNARGDVGPYGLWLCAAWVGQVS